MDDGTKKPRKIIRIILRKPNGQEEMEEIPVDSKKSSPKDLEKLIKDNLRKKLPKIKDSKMKIISQIIDTKPGEDGEETTEEFEMNPEMARKNLDDAMKRAPRTKTLKKKDPFGKIITKISRQKSDGKEEILREFVGDEDPAKMATEKPMKTVEPHPATEAKKIEAKPVKQTDKPSEKKDKPPITIHPPVEQQKKSTISTEQQRPKSPISPKDDKQQKRSISRKSPEPVDDSAKKSKPKKLIRIILRRPNGEESVEDSTLDINATGKDVDKTIKTLLRKKLPQIKDPKTKVITQIIDLKPGSEETIEEFETDPEIARKNLNQDDVLKKTILTKITKKKDPLSGKIIVGFYKRKPNGEEIVEEMVEDPRQTGKDIGDTDTIGRLPKELQEKVSKILSPKEVEKPKDISTKKSTTDTIDDRKAVMPKPSDDKQQKKESKPVEKPESQKDDDDKKRPKKLIRIIIRKPNGDEQIEDLLIDPDTKPEDINDTIKQELQNVLNKSPNIPNDAKIITKIIDLKPEESESIEEFEMDPETARKNLDDAVKQTPRTKTSKKKDPFGKIITKIFLRKPDGKEEIVQEFVEDPKQTGKDIGDLDNIGRVPEGLKSIDPEFFGKSPKRPKKIIRIILRQPNGDESIQDLSVDQNTTPKDLDKMIKDAIEKELSKIDDPKTKIISKVIDSKPGEEETTEEFEMDPETARKNLDDAVKKAPRTKTSKKKDSLGKIITKIFRRKPDGKEEILREFVEDPKQTGKDIGDDDQPKPVSESMTTITDPTGKTIIRIVRKMPDGSQSVQELIEEPEKKHDDKPTLTTLTTTIEKGPKDTLPLPKDTVDNVLGQFSDPQSKPTIKTLENVLTKQKPLDDISEGEFEFLNFSPKKKSTFLT